MKKTLFYILVLLLLINNAIISQKRYSSIKSPYKSNSSFNYKTPKAYSPPKPFYKSPTYKANGTEYKVGEYYKSSGLLKVKRSSTNKKDFLKSRGYTKSPNGYEVDHITPLSQGGLDIPSNMQLLPKEIHKIKTTSERRKEN